MLDYVIRAKQLDETIREQLRNALLLKHVHQHEKEYHHNNGSTNGMGGEKSHFILSSHWQIWAKSCHILT